MNAYDKKWVFMSDDFWLSGEVERCASCPVCESSASGGSLYCDLSDKQEGVPGRWSGQICRVCGCFFLDCRPVREAIGKAYGTYYTHSNALAAHAVDNGDSFMWKLINGYMNKRYGSKRVPSSSLGEWLVPIVVPLRLQVDYFYRHLPRKSGRLLDVGCGNGRFLLRARDAGWDSYGLDLDPAACSSSRDAGFQVFQGAVEDYFPDVLFDVITASHVIEHVYSPHSMIGRIYELLRPGGYVWIATPNIRSLGHAFYKSYWRGLEAPRHLVVFSASALVDLLSGAGFRDIEVKRRGRGAKFILNSSREISEREGGRVRSLPSFMVDLMASVSSEMSEELVVVARRPE